MSTNLPMRSFQVFLLAMSILTLELALTRIFSFISFHHLTYLVISVAMLGFGAAGTYLTVRTDVNTSTSDEFLAYNAWLLGMTAIAAVVLIPRIYFDLMHMIQQRDYSHLISLFIIVLLTAAPFFFGGTCIGYIISKLPPQPLIVITSTRPVFIQKRRPQRPYWNLVIRPCTLSLTQVNQFLQDIQSF